MGTTSTSVTELVYAKVIDDLIIAYQYDDVTAVPYFRFKSLVGQPSATASFPRWVKDAHEDVANEAAALTPVEMETTAVDITVARVGIARETSETAFEDTILGRAAFINEIVMDHAVLFGEAIDEDATALFASATGVVTNTGVDITIADLVNGMGTQRAAKARGPQVIHLHDETGKQLQAAQAAATSTPWATFFQPNADSTAFLGYFMGAPVWASSKNPTANAAADRVGCIWAQGQAAPKTCAFGFVVKRVAATKYDEDILEDTHLAATYMRYGVGVVAANFATKLVFDA